jgi:hypothetical protein
VSDGNVIQGTQYADGYDYLVTVPYNSTEEFAIYAQAKNPYIAPELAPVLTQGNDGGVELGDTLVLTEGLNEYTITVTSADENYTNIYTIKVIKLPDLSLATFQVKKDAFVRDLAQLAKQNVYVPYDSVTVFAVAAAENSGATVSITPDNGAVSSLGVKTPTPVTVTVRKDSLEVDPIYKTASYTLDLYYGAGMAVSPAAEGGNVSFIPGDDDDDVYYEVHTFSEAGPYTLSFGGGTESITADVFIVAGGGGGGGYRDVTVSDYAGGGGAGGLLYETGYSLTLPGGSVSVVVGAGGNGGAVKTQGSNGGNSWIEPSEDGSLTAQGGGGGGGSHMNMQGKDGGSGGGGGSGSSSNCGAGGNGTNGQGYNGGKGGNSGNSGNSDAGGGGGGAAGPGKAPSGNRCEIPGDGGPGWQPSEENGALWIYDVTQTAEFSHGGKGGGAVDYVAPHTNGANYGDGGSGGYIQNSGGASGRSGIVIVRFQRKLEEKQN